MGCMKEELTQLSFFGTAMPAIVDGDGGGLAHFAGGKTVSRPDGYGRTRPALLLAGSLDEWRRRGRPGVAQLDVEVSFGRSRRRGWRSRSRGDAVIYFDWR